MGHDVGRRGRRGAGGARPPLVRPLFAVGLLVTPVFLILLAVLAGSECAGLCARPVWTAPLALALLLAGPVAAAAGGLGLVAARRRREPDDGVD